MDGWMDGFVVAMWIAKPSDKSILLVSLKISCISPSNNSLNILPQILIISSSHIELAVNSTSHLAHYNKGMTSPVLVEKWKWAQNKAKLRTQTVFTA